MVGSNGNGQASYPGISTITDGAGAVVLQASDTPGIVHTNILSDGQFSKLLYAKNTLWSGEDKPILKMNGKL